MLLIGILLTVLSVSSAISPTARGLAASTLSLQPPVDTTTLKLSHDDLSMNTLTVDPAGVMDGGSWETQYSVVNMLRPSKCWGIYVGIISDDPPLAWSWNDAIMMRDTLETYPGYDDTLTRLHLGGMSSSYVPPPGYPPYPGNASWQDVNESINWVFNNAADHDTVVFYFSGHGWRNNTAKFPLFPPFANDGTPIDEPDFQEEGLVFAGIDGNEWVSDDMLFNAFLQFENKPKVGLVLIFDSCHSGGLIDGFFDLQNLENPHAILMGCNQYESAWQMAALTHYTYTYYLLDGLKPAKRTSDLYEQSYTTQADKTCGNNDGVTTARELHDYAAPRTVHYPTPTQQHPCIRLSETKSRELIFNVYEPLVRFSEKKTLVSGDTPYNCTSIIDFELHLADGMSFTFDLLNWTFHIRSGVMFQDWTDRFGFLHSGDLVTPEDVEYSFDRALVQDPRDSPVWDLYYLLTGQHSSDAWDLDDDDGNLNATEALAAANVLANCITRDDLARTVTFCLNDTAVNTINASAVTPFDLETCLLQNLAQSCYIVNKNFAVDYGCWPGSWDVNETYSWAHWRRYPNNDCSPLDQTVPEAGPFPSNRPAPPVMCGTGPYSLTYLNKTTHSYRIDKFTPYWRGWPANGNPSSIDTMIVTGTPYWSGTRMMQFASGDFDSVDVPRSQIYELLSYSSGYKEGYPLIHFVNFTTGYYFERSWVKGWYYNAFYPGLYAYHLYKEGPPETEDVDVSVSINPITFYPLIQVWSGEMRRGHVNSYQGGYDYYPAKFLFNVTVTRKDNNPNCSFVMVAIGLKRTNSTGFSTFTNATLILLPWGSFASTILTWYEDGAEQSITAGSWEIGAEVYIVNGPGFARDAYLTDNECTAGTVQVKRLDADVTGDGYVDIFDAIVLANMFAQAWINGGLGGLQALLLGKTDFNGDGTVDIYDAIRLANNFNQHIP